MLQNPHTTISVFAICYYLVVTGHCCESMTHRLTAVRAVTCDHKITTHNKLYKLQHDITLCNMLAYLCLCFLQ